jgi:hypothetical protein
MAEIVTVTTAKPPVESVTVKLTAGDARDVIRAMDKYYGPGTGLVSKLKDAVEGKTAPSLADALFKHYAAPRF